VCARKFLTVGCGFEAKLILPFRFTTRDIIYMNFTHYLPSIFHFSSLLKYDNKYFLNNLRDIFKLMLLKLLTLLRGV